jgi:hypothetical protein
MSPFVVFPDRREVVNAWRTYLHYRVGSDAVPEGRALPPLPTKQSAVPSVSIVPTPGGVETIVPLLRTTLAPTDGTAARGPEVKAWS